MPAVETSQYRSPYHPASWLPDFRSRTVKTRIVAIPMSVLDALLSNSLSFASASDLPVEWSDGTTTSCGPSHTTPGIRKVSATLTQKVAELDGAVAPKLGCRAPTDATWANFFRSTKCTSADDILSLLAASERVTADASSDEVIVLRQWADMDSRMEFRAFIKDDVVVGICQRTEICVEYEEAEMDSLVDLIVQGYREIAHRWRGPSRYIMDVYIDRRKIMWVVDFAEWLTADSLLFQWPELENALWSRAQFRCAVGGVRPADKLLDGVPLELRNVGAMQDLVEAARNLAVETGIGSTEEGCNGNSFSDHND